MGWNQFDTGAYDGMVAEATTIQGKDGEFIGAYFARPMGEGPFPGVVLVHHVPGWDEFYRETARRFAQHGYSVICPDLFHRFGHGAPDDIAAAARGAGFTSDDTVVSDLGGGVAFLRALPTASGKVGMVGSCSGGRYTFLTACRAQRLDAAIDLWGGQVVMTPDQITPQRPVPPIEYTEGLSCPLLGLFGNDDKSPTPEQVDTLEAELKRHGKEYEFHRYDGAGHGFFYYHWAMYRQEQAMDAWAKIFDFFGRKLGVQSR